MSKKWRIVLIIICILAIAAAAVLAAMRFWLPTRRIQQVEQAALDQLGKPYVFGTAGPDSFDCSGLMKYAYAAVDVELDHNTRTVAADESYETIDEPDQLQRGDLVYFNTVSSGSRIDHVGLWLGDNQFVHASSANGEVMVSDFDERWQERFVLAKRIL